MEETQLTGLVETTEALADHYRALREFLVPFQYLPILFLMGISVIIKY